MFPSPSSKISLLCFFGERRRVSSLRLVADAVMSLKARLEAPILLPLEREARGVKNLAKDFGVTVGLAFGLRPLSLVGFIGEDGISA